MTGHARGVIVLLQIVQMLSDLPELFNGSPETDSCLGSALQAAYKMVSISISCWFLES
jgi:hypothetical protein